MKRAVRAASVLLTALACIPASVHATYTLDHVLGNLESREESMNSLRFDFVQDIDFKQMGSQAEVKGNATFAKGGKMRIAKTHPDEQLTVSNGKKLWVYVPANNQVWAGSLKGWVKSTVLPQGIVPFNHYVSDLKQNFNLKIMAEDPGAHQVRVNANPKDPSVGYRLEFVFSTESWLPTETIYRSDSGEVTTKLSKLEVNPELAGDSFQFKPPATADVIPLD